MDTDLDRTAIETFDLLEARLRRIEFAVGGATIPYLDGSNTTNAAKRLAQLEHSLHQLASRSRIIQDLLKLHARHPDLFQSSGHDELPTILDTQSILSIVLASASAYPATASRLTSILDVPIPPAEKSTQLVDLVPRIAKVEALQALQKADISALRERTAIIIQQWYMCDVLSVGDAWADIEGRVGQVEQQVRRVALARRLDDHN